MKMKTTLVHLEKPVKNCKYNKTSNKRYLLDSNGGWDVSGILGISLEKKEVILVLVQPQP